MILITSTEASLLDEAELITETFEVELDIPFLRLTAQEQEALKRIFPDLNLEWDMSILDKGIEALSKRPRKRVRAGIKLAYTKESNQWCKDLLTVVNNDAVHVTSIFGQSGVAALAMVVKQAMMVRTI